MANLVKVGSVTINLDLVTEIHERPEESTLIIFAGGTSTSLVGASSIAFRHYLEAFVSDLGIESFESPTDEIASNVDEGGPGINDERQ